MTMLLTTTTPFGIIIAADRRLTWLNGRMDDNHRKIVPWLEMRAAVGFAGLATIDGGFTDEVIERLMQARGWQTLDDFAAALGPELQHRIPANMAREIRRMYVHVVGFGPAPGTQRAQLHYVRNCEWEVILDFFQVAEDLRDSFLSRRGILSIEDLAKSNFFLVQFSGVRPYFSRRAQRMLSREVRHLHDLDDVANWARGQIRAVALDLKKANETPVVGEDALVYRITPHEVVEH